MRGRPFGTIRVACADPVYPTLLELYRAKAEAGRVTGRRIEKVAGQILIRGNRLTADQERDLREREQYRKRFRDGE